MLAGAARCWSASSRLGSCASCSSRSSPTPEERERLLTGRPRRRRRVFECRRGEASRRRCLVRGAARPLLADGGPRRRPAAAAHRRRPALGRSSLAALHLLSGAAPGGPARSRSSRRPARTSRARTPHCSPSSPRSAHGVDPARRAQRRRRARCDRARASARTPDQALRRGLPYRHRGQPAAAARAAEGDRGRGDARRPPRTRGSFRELGPRAASRAVLLRLSRLSPRGAGRRARAAAVLDEGFDVPTLAALAGVDEPVAARATGELSQAEILRPTQPLGFVHPLIRAAVYQEIPPGERELAARRRGAAAGGGRSAGRAHRLAPARRCRRAARSGCSRRSARPPARRCRRAPPTARSRTFAGRSRSLRPRGRGRRRCWSWASVESLTYAPAAVESPARGLRAPRRPVSRGLAANVLARTLMWESPPEAARLARTAAAEMPPDQRQVALAPRRLPGRADPRSASTRRDADRADP